MNINTRKCDNCSKIKQDTNKWYVVITDSHDDITGEHDSILILKKDPIALANHAKAFDCCGQGCTVEMVTRLMGERKGD